ncbi:MAG: DUF5453 family protein [Bacilli bacterium]|nr:DUF5453 family protein [Bacilli bacterium]
MLYLCLFLPASISILISEKLRKEKRNLSELVIPYLGYTFIINLIMTIIYHFIHTGKINWYSSKLFTIDFTMQYMLISFAVAIAISCLLFIISKVVQINIDVKERKKDVKKSSKNYSADYKRKH